MQIFTIGYEGVTQAEVIGRLKGAGAAQALPMLVFPMVAVFALVRLKNPALAVLAALGLVGEVGNWRIRLGV